MSNDYFRYAANILPGGTARSQPITQTFEALARAFELLPNPIDDGVNRGFSQPVQIAPAAENNEAATLGQVQQIVEAIAGLNPLADGSLQPVFRGSYDPASSYTPMEFVTWEGGLYVNVLASSGVAPSDAGNWLLVISPLNTGVVYYEALSGAVTRPMIAYHNGDYWILAMDLPQAEMAIPGESLAWQRIPRDTTFIITPSITNPADGAEQFFGEITSSQYQTGPRFTGAHTKTVWQSSTKSDFATIYAEEEITEGDLYTWALPLPDPLATVWIRVRYESNGFSSDWSPIVRVVIADYKADPPEWIDPVVNEVDWMPGSTLQITPYSPNLTDEHVATSWQILNASGTVVWQSLEDANNLTSIATPSNIFNPEATYTFRAWHIGQFFGEQDPGEISVTTIAAPSISLSAPLDGEMDVGATPSLSIDAIDSAFAHEASQWRVIKDADGTAVIDSGETASALESYEVPFDVLAVSTTYRWDVRIKTSEYGFSPWASQHTFITMDAFPPSRIISGPPSIFRIRGIVSDADKVYISKEEKPWLDILNKSDWSFVSGIPVLNNQTYSMYGSISVDDNYIFFGGRGYYSSDPSFWVIDKNTLSILSSKSYGAYTSDISNDASFVYLTAVDSPYFKVLNKADWSEVPGAPVLPNQSYAVHNDANYVYVGYRDSPYFKIFNKSDWSEVPGTPALTGNVLGIHSDDSYIYLVHFGAPYFTVISKQDWTIVPGTPSLPGYGKDVISDSNFVYIAREHVEFTDVEFTVISKSDWSIVGGVPELKGADCVHVDNDYVYASFVVME